MKKLIFLIALFTFNLSLANSEISARCSVEGRPYTLKNVTVDNPQKDPFGGVEKREIPLEFGFSAAYLVGVGYGGNNHTLRILKNNQVVAQDQQYGVTNKVAFNGDRLNLRINIFINQKSILCLVD